MASVGAANRQAIKAYQETEIATIAIMTATLSMSDGWRGIAVAKMLATDTAERGLARVVRSPS